MRFTHIPPHIHPHFLTQPSSLHSSIQCTLAVLHGTWGSLYVPHAHNSSVLYRFECILSSTDPPVTCTFNPHEAESTLLGLDMATAVLHTVHSIMASHIQYSLQIDTSPHLIKTLPQAGENPSCAHQDSILIPNGHNPPYRSCCWHGCSGCGWCWWLGFATHLTGNGRSWVEECAHHTGPLSSGHLWHVRQH